MRTAAGLWLLIIVGLMWAAAASAQPARRDSSKPTPPPDTSRAVSASPDTTRPNRPADRTRPGDTNAYPVYVMTKSPTTAILLSLVCPGAGQVYNEQWWKAGIFLGAAGYFLGRAFYLNGLYIDKRTEAGLYPTNSSTYALLKQQREAYRDDRDLNYAYAAGVWIVGMIDAYVGAHLFDFDVSTDKSSQIYIPADRPGIGLAMRW